MNQKQELLQTTQEFLNLVRQAKSLLPRINQLQEDVLPKDLRLDPNEYAALVNEAEDLFKSACGLAGHIGIVKHLEDSDRTS